MSKAEQIRKLYRSGVKSYELIELQVYGTKGNRNNRKRISKVLTSKKELCLFKKYLVLTDLHLPFSDDESIKRAVDYGLTAGCNSLLLLGDVFDFYEISKWGGKFRMPIEQELAEAEDKLSTLIDSRYDWEDKIFIKGNHEDRFERYISQNARRIQNLLDNKGFTLPEILGLGKLGFRFIDQKQYRIDNGKFFSLGKLIPLHGHEIPCGGKYPAKNTIMKAHDNIIMGHHHKKDVAFEKDLSGHVKGVHSIGCLCEMIPDYMVVNEWWQGFGIATVKDNGFFHVDNLIIDKESGEVF